MVTKVTLHISEDNINKFHELTPQLNTAIEKHLATHQHAFAVYRGENRKLIEALLEKILNVTLSVTIKLPPLTLAAKKAINAAFAQEGLPLGDRKSAPNVQTLVKYWGEGQRWIIGGTRDLLLDQNKSTKNPLTVATHGGGEIYLPHALDPNLAQKIKTVIADAINTLSDEDKSELKEASDMVRAMIARRRLEEVGRIISGAGVTVIQPEDTPTERSITVEEIREAVADQQRFAEEQRPLLSAYKATKKELKRIVGEMQEVYIASARESGIINLFYPSHFMRLTNGNWYLDSKEKMLKILELFPTSQEHLEFFHRKEANGTPVDVKWNQRVKRYAEALDRHVGWFDL